MKHKLNTIKVVLPILLITFFLNGCLITEVVQSLLVEVGGMFTATITVTDITADANANVGALAVLVPSDWEFYSGTYDSDVGTGDLILDENNPPVYGDLDGTIPPPDGMKWVRLISDLGYAHGANVTHEATVNFIVGQTTGDFEIGYMVTKNSADLLAAINTTEEDSDAAWADSSMNHKCSVEPATAVDDNFVTYDYALQQNYPNPFNPTTAISFNLAKSQHVTLKVYDALGNEVTTLMNGMANAGQTVVNFNAKNLASGTYIYKLETESFVQSRKMVLLK